MAQKRRREWMEQWRDRTLSDGSPASRIDNMYPAVLSGQQRCEPNRYDDPKVGFAMPPLYARWDGDEEGSSSPEHRHHHVQPPTTRTDASIEQRSPLGEHIGEHAEHEGCVADDGETMRDGSAVSFLVPSAATPQLS